MSGNGEFQGNAFAKVVLGCVGFVLASLALNAATRRLNAQEEKKPTSKLSQRKLSFIVPNVEKKESPSVPMTAVGSGKNPTPPLKSAPHKDILDEELMNGKLLEGTSVSGIYVHTLRSLTTELPSAQLLNEGLSRSHSHLQYNKLIGKEDFIINDIVRKPGSSTPTDAFIRAGPRKYLHFNPKEVKAAIVTCGGLCPGLNN
eukprot:gene33857-40961_t